MALSCLPCRVFGIAENVDTAVVTVGLADDWNLGENEFEFSRFLCQKFVKFSRQKSGIVLIQSRRRILIYKRSESLIH